MNMETPKSVAGRLADLLRARQSGDRPEAVDDEPAETPDGAGAPPEPEMAADTVSAEEIMLRVARTIRGEASGRTPPAANPDDTGPPGDDPALQLGEWRVDGDGDALTPEQGEAGSDEDAHLPEGLSEAMARIDAEDAQIARRAHAPTVRQIPDGNAAPDPRDRNALKSPPAIAVVAQPYGIRVPEGPGLHRRRMSRMAAGSYAPREIDAALAVVRPEDVVLDLGAGTGLVGVAVARAIAPRRVIAVDPHPDLAASLAAIYGCNALAPRSQVWQGALVADAGDARETSLFLADDPVASSTCGPANGRKAVLVPCSPFGQFCDEHGVTVMLADMNGAELDLLSGADLSHLRALVVRFYPRIYGGEAMRKAKGAIRAAGFAPLKAHSTRQFWVCTRTQGATVL